MIPMKGMNKKKKKKNSTKTSIYKLINTYVYNKINQPLKG